mmetsp:Transcript_62137/g.128809  ORF Transcript_62137/g.128809 Transcript_62137/m.128809 type:complete len:210 (+) Transcript_62137:2433-3062(+)
MASGAPIPRPQCAGTERCPVGQEADTHATGPRGTSHDHPGVAQARTVRGYQDGGRLWPSSCYTDVLGGGEKTWLPDPCLNPDSDGPASIKAAARRERVGPGGPAVRTPPCGTTRHLGERRSPQATARPGAGPDYVHPSHERPADEASRGSEQHKGRPPSAGGDPAGTSASLSLPWGLPGVVWGASQAPAMDGARPNEHGNHLNGRAGAR